MNPRGRTDAYGQEVRTDSELRGERQREWIREKCMTGVIDGDAELLIAAREYIKAREFAKATGAVLARLLGEETVTMRYGDGHFAFSRSPYGASLPVHVEAVKYLGD